MAGGNNTTKFLLALLLSGIITNSFAGKVKSMPDSLFNIDKVLEIQITGKISRITRSRQPKGKRRYQSAQIAYTTNDGERVVVNTQIGTRGHFRLNPRICNFPPLMLKFNKKEAKNTIFRGIEKVKLVTHCQKKKKIYQQYMLREYLVYKVYNLLTPASYRVRLAKITYVETAKKSKSHTKFGFFLEPSEMMAKRNNASLYNIDKVAHHKVDSIQCSFVSMFQFMIGNTDFSFSGDHNVERIIPQKGPCIGVPYDFDFSGIVGTPYATPSARAKSQSTKDRHYHGYCQSVKTFESIFNIFIEKKKAIYNIYYQFPFITNKYRKSTIKFLDEFYKIISTPRLIKNYILAKCIGK